MEELYGDLENYNDVILVHELRDENKNLKVKLEEYATAMGKLQKDYDNLELQFKQLEKNYSSLLKTAREEVKRKTNLISQLNAEKDKLVLTSLQNNNRRIFQKSENKGKHKSSDTAAINKNSNEEKLKKPNVNSGLRKNIVNDVNSKKHSRDDFLNEVETESVLQKVNRDPTLDVKEVEGDKQMNKWNPMERYEAKTQNRPTSSNEGSENRNHYPDNRGRQPSSYQIGEYKENVMSCQKQDIGLSRMRAGGIQNRRKSMPAASMPLSKFSSDDELEPTPPNEPRRTEALMSETSDIRRRFVEKISSDRFSNKTSETSSIDDRSSNYYESRDNYRSRNNRNYETDKYRNRDKMEVSNSYRKHYSPDRYRRGYRDYDEYNRSEYGRSRAVESPPDPFSRHLRRNIDPRHRHDSDQYRHRYEERHAVKYKRPIDYIEPHSKRQKRESGGQSEVIFQEERNHQNNDDIMETISIPEEFETQYTSCQSPDYEPLHPDRPKTKEIKLDADVKIDDPRTKTDKYVSKTENGQLIWVSVKGTNNIDCVPIDKCKWSIETVKVPEALRHYPSQSNEVFVQDIYMGLDGPTSNTSMEIGELYFGSEVCASTKPNEKEIKTSEQNTNTNKNVNKDILKQSENSENNVKPANSVTNKSQEIQLKDDEGNNESIVSECLSEIPCNDSNINEKITVEVECYKISPTQIHTDDHDHVFSNSGDKKDEQKINDDNNCPTRLSNMALVEGDLELSDETSDNIETQKQTTSVLIRPDIDVKIENHVEENITHDKHGKKSNDVEIVKSRGKLKDVDSNKKHKSKKRKSKSKDSSSKKSAETSNVDQNSQKKIKSKKDKSKDIKNKFSDLFGDSNSLITPEDLGIPPVYVPICEDAQDAVDINMKQCVNTPENTPLDARKETSNDKNTSNSPQGQNRDEMVKTDTTKELSQNYNIEIDEEPKENNNMCLRTPDETIVTTEVRLPENIVYENLNAGAATNEHDVVKTVIISTGVQPQFNLENDDCKERIEIPITEVAVGQQEIDSSKLPHLLELKRQNCMQALATSTPHKSPAPAPSIPLSSIIDPNDGKIENLGPIAHSAPPVNAETHDPQDAPDVRIFVKRRRKVLKRPPIT